MQSRLYPSLGMLCALSLLAPAVHGDVLTGRVVDAQNVGVAGVDIDIRNLGPGGDPPIVDDSTDAQGVFSIVVPTGLYELTFNPPPPPVTTHLVLEIEDIVVVGTKDIGVVSLPPGVGLTGTVRDSLGQPVPNVDLDIVDELAGTKLTLFGDSSDATGAFSLAVPAGPIEVRFDPAPVAGPTLAPVAFELNPSGDVDLGFVELEPGFQVSATVLGPNAVPVVNADVDAEELVQGSVYTPGDNTNASGFVDFVVAAGTYDFEFCAPTGPGLAGGKISNVTVGATTLLGTVMLAPGVSLSGSVQGPNGQPLVGVDVNVFDLVTGESLALCGDNTDTNGDYAILVPAGSYAVHFTPPATSPYAPTQFANVAVFTATTLNASLADLGAVTYCTAKASSSGCTATITGLTAQGPVSGASDWSVVATGVEANRIGIFIGAVTVRAAIPFKGGTLCMQPPLKRGFPMQSGGLGGTCNGSFSLLVNDGNAFPPSGSGFDPGLGATSFMQAWYRDPQLQDGFGVALSDALEIHWQ